MMTLRSMYQFTARDLALLSQLVRQRIGLHFAPEKYDLLAEKLAPLLSERGMDSFLDYYYYLKYDPQGEAEWEQIEQALTVNETYFWREFGALRVAAEKLVPDLQRDRPDTPVRIWHAACASGEEPYSMAIALTEKARFLYGEVDILGTDINRHALRQAEAGVYARRSFRSIPPDILEKYFEPLGSGSFRLLSSIMRRVRFAYCNLVDARAVQAQGVFDIIFCRNVWIYFDEETVTRVARNLYHALHPGGYVAVGAAESLLRYPQWFQPCEIDDVFLYRRV
ncbi:MAG: protein-glutamate O-methyltransferase CheR [Anaerolineae bacterium]|nr:MAG: protein-glutamate O-methyltransferase CheR [Anaerolineae bacterium]